MNRHFDTVVPFTSRMILWVAGHYGNWLLAADVVGDDHDGVTCNWR